MIQPALALLLLMLWTSEESRFWAIPGKFGRGIFASRAVDTESSL